MQFKISCVRKVAIFLILISLSLPAMENFDVESLKDIVSKYVAKNSSLAEQATNLPLDVQALISKRLQHPQIKDELFPVKIKTPENLKSPFHNGVCGLEGISEYKQVISIGCDGKIAICNEDAMHECNEFSTEKSWVCACLKSEPSMLCLGDIGGKIGFLGLQDKKVNNIFHAHDQLISALSLFNNQESLISCSNDARIKLWNVENNTHLATLAGHTASVKNAVALMADQKILSASVDKTIRLWDIGTAKEEQSYSLVNSLIANTYFSRLARHPNEQVAITGLNSGMLMVWDIRQKKHVACLRGHKSGVSALLCAEDGNYVASAAWDSKTRIWDLRMLACSAILSFHEGWIQSITSLHRFKKIVSGARDGTVKIWDLSSILAIDEMKDLKETDAKIALIKTEKPISNADRLAMLKKITAKPQA